ncbi:MAG: hypothetical protein JWM02_2023 [Frankiales bacterium]|nr:hypothetical protein [Frankiales bacterium]
MLRYFPYRQHCVDTAAVAIIGSYRPSLDGLRALAITLVMAEHAQIGLARAGGLGVDVFFVLSGYLITGLLAGEHARTQRIRFGAFYLRRATRLYPALLALVTVGGVVLWLELKTPWRHLAKAGLIAATYLTDLFSFGHGSTWALWGHTWSLAVEEHFYLLWPPVLLLLLRRGSRVAAKWWALAGAVAGVVVVVALAVPGHAGPPTFYFQPHAHAGALLLGCAVALTPAWPAWSKNLTAPALLGLLALILVSPSPVHASYYRVSLPLAWLLTAALLVGLEAESGLSRALAWRPWRRIGVISYGLYLYHQLVFFVVGRHLTASHRAVVVTEFLVCFVVADLSYRFLEAPIRRRGQQRAARSDSGLQGRLEAAPSEVGG